MGDDTDLEKRVGQLEAKIAELEAEEREAAKNHDSAGRRKRSALALGRSIGASSHLGAGATSSTALNWSVGTDAKVVTSGY